MVPVAGHFLEHDGHLFDGQVATFVDLFSEGRQNVGVAATESNGVAVEG